MRSYFIWKRINEFVVLVSLVFYLAECKNHIFYATLESFEVMNIEELCKSLREEIRIFFFILSLNFPHMIHSHLSPPLSHIINLYFLNPFSSVSRMNFIKLSQWWISDSKEDEEKKMIKRND
jgi:hypothetical protein